MIDAMKQMMQAKKIADEMNKNMKNTPLDIEYKGIKISGNLVSVDKISIEDESLLSDKLKLEELLLKAFNKFLEDSEDKKKKVMTQSMGGMSGMMDMLKSLKG